MRTLPSLLAATGLLIAPSSPASVRSMTIQPAAQEKQLERCIERSAHGRIWLARTLWALRDQEGGWVGAAVRNRDGTYDLGPLQINSWWTGRIAALLDRKPIEIRWWLQHDACFNVDAARWIFLSALVVTRDYWTAIGVYHSPVAWRQRRYTQGVVNQLSARFGRSVFRKGQAR